MKRAYLLLVTLVLACSTSCSSSGGGHSGKADAFGDATSASDSTVPLQGGDTGYPGYVLVDGLVYGPSGSGCSPMGYYVGQEPTPQPAGGTCAPETWLGAECHVYQAGDGGWWGRNDECCPGLRCQPEMKYGCQNYDDNLVVGICSCCHGAGDSETCKLNPQDLGWCTSE